jgi:hypothetical protein
MSRKSTSKIKGKETEIVEAQNGMRGCPAVLAIFQRELTPS